MRIKVIPRVMSTITSVRLRRDECILGAFCRNVGLGLFIYETIVNKIRGVFNGEDV